MVKDYFLEITNILNEASGDEGLSNSEYANLCFQIAIEAKDRATAAEEDDE